MNPIVLIEPHEMIGDLQSLGRIASIGVASREMVKNFLLYCIGRRRRDRQRVRAEYDEGHWLQVLERRNWEHVQDLQSFLDPGTDDSRIAKICNQYVRLKTRDYYRYRTEMLHRVIAEFTRDKSEVVELGCGFGMNLFALLGKKQWSRVVGCDVSENAIRAGKEIAAQFNLSDVVRFHLIDLIDPDSPGFAQVKGRRVFTYYCLEQLKHFTECVIENIRRAGPAQVLHVEPTFELLRWWSMKDLGNYLYIKRQDYQDNLLVTLRKLESQGKVRIVCVQRLYYAPSINHDPTLICWEPT